MEDMAEICGQLQLFGQALTWLERPFDGALKVWGAGPLYDAYMEQNGTRSNAEPADQRSDLFWK
jgi:hypothetical protein